MYPLFTQTQPKRLGVRFSDTIAIEIVSDGFRRGWSTFLHYGSDFFPDGQSFVQIEWMSQFLMHAYTWVASLVLEPTDVLHSWIYIGWVTSGCSVYWATRHLGGGLVGSVVSGIVVQIMPAFRWFAINHVNYMFIAAAIIPAAHVLREATQVNRKFHARPFVYAGIAHFILLFLDGYIGYFAVLLTILAFAIASTISTRARLERGVFLAISMASIISLFIFGRFFAYINRENADRTLRTYVAVVESDVRMLVNSMTDLGFGNLTPYLGWPVIILLIVGVSSLRRFRSLFAIGVLVGVSSAFAVSTSTWSWGIPSDVLGKFIPRMRYYDRYAVLIAIVLIAIAFGATLRTSRTRIPAPLLPILGLATAVATSFMFQPQLLRGETDSSVMTADITSSINPDQAVVLRIGSPPHFAGLRFASFPSGWDERYALSRGNNHLRDIACATGVTHILVNDRLDGAWQTLQYMSAYVPREWVNFDDRRYFIPRATGWWDDRSDATTYERKPLQLYALRSCAAPGNPINSLAAPIEVVNDGVIVRQIRPDVFNNLNFAVSPEVIVEPRFRSDHRESILLWRFTVGVADGFTPPILDLDVAASGSPTIPSIALRVGQSRLLIVKTEFPHKLIITTRPRSSASAYFSIANFTVNRLASAN